MPTRNPKSRRGAQGDAARALELHRLLVERAPQMLWAAVEDGSVDFFNARTYEYTGKTPGELEGWSWRAVVHADDWERCAALWTKALKKGQPYEVECRLRRHDGRYLWHLVAAMPVREGG